MFGKFKSVKTSICHSDLFVSIVMGAIHPYPEFIKTGRVVGTLTASPVRARLNDHGGA
jgi:hypothetical protein